MLQYNCKPANEFEWTPLLLLFSKRRCKIQPVTNDYDQKTAPNVQQDEENTNDTAGYMDDEDYEEIPDHKLVYDSFTNF